MVDPEDDGCKEWIAALLPLRFDDHVAPSGDVDVKTTAGRPILMQHADQAEQRRFLQALLELSWLPPEVRRAVAKALSPSLRQRKVDREAGRTAAFKLMVGEVKARMHAAGERPARGDIYTAAIEEVAEQAGIEPEALRKRLQRSRRIPRRR